MSSTENKRVLCGIATILSSLSAILSLAFQATLVFLRHFQSQGELLLAQSALRRNEFVFRLKRQRRNRTPRVYWKKPGISFTLSALKSIAFNSHRFLYSLMALINASIISFDQLHLAAAILKCTRTAGSCLTGLSR